MAETRVRRLATWLKTDGWVYLAAAVLTTIATALALELWRADLSVPFTYTGDATYIAANIKTDVMRGWYEWEPLLAAPFGQNFHDYKAADNLSQAILSLMGRFTSDWALVENLYYLAGYPLAALTAVAFLRRLRIARPLAVVLAVCFAIAPYHFARQEWHLFLSSYWAIPLGMLVVLWVAKGEAIWTRRRAAFTAIALVLVASTNSYYGLFMIAFIAIGGLVQVIIRRDWKRFVGAFAASVWTAATMLANMLPDIIYSALHGANPGAVVRFPSETEVYALKLTQLVLPMHGHRFGPFDTFRAMYDSVYPFPSGYPALGIIGSAGLLIAILLVLVRAFDRSAGKAREGWHEVGVLSGLTLFGILIATLGGGSTIVSFFTSDLRGWDRMSIVLTLLTLAITGLCLTMLTTHRRVLSSWLRSGAVWLAAAVVMLVGFWDQTSPKLAPDYEGISATFAADASLVQSISDQVGPNASILQLPYSRYPETAPVNSVPDSDQLKFFLHSDTLRWSGGAIKGRAITEWPAALERLPADDIPAAIAAAGFDGVLLDLRTLTDPQLRDAIIEGLGVPVLTTPDGRFEFYDARPLRAAIVETSSEAEVEKIGELVTHAVYARFSPNELDGWSVPETLQPYRPQIVFDNPRSSAANVTVAFDLATTQGPGTVRLTMPDGSIEVFRLSATSRHLELDLSVPPGSSSITISGTGGTTLERAFGTQGPLIVTGIEVVDPELREALGQLAAVAAQ